MDRGTHHLNALGLLVMVALPVHGASYPQQPVAAADLVCVSNGGLVCMDSTDFGRQWSALDGEHTLEPVIADGRVLVGGAAGLQVFDAATGTLRWQWTADGLVFPPTVADGVVYASDQHGRFRALDLDSGRVLWQRRFSGWSYPPAVIGDRLVTGGRDGVVRGLDVADGTTRWRLSVEQELVYRPVAAGQLAIVTTFDGTVTAIDREGRRVWSVRDPAASFSPAVAGDLVLLGGWDGRLRARRRHTGDLVWERDIGAGQLNLPARPGPEGDTLGLATPDGEMLLLDRATGRIKHRTAPMPDAIGSPIHLPAHGWVILSRRSGTIVRRRLSESGAGE